MKGGIKMKYDIISPNSFQKEDKNSFCSIFLAGPTSGNKSWRPNFINDLNDKIRSEIKVTFYSPQWGDYKLDPHFYDKSFNEDDQIYWEYTHLSKADIIIFGLFNPDDAGKNNAWTNSHDYAQTTRYELGRYTVPGSMNSVIIYGEQGFKGLSYIKKMTELSGKNRWYTENYEIFLDIIYNEILNCIKNNEIVQKILGELQ